MVLMKCPACRTRISRTWLILALPWSKYRCDSCGSVFAGTILRFVVNTAAMGVIGFFAIRALKGNVNPLILLPMFGLVAVLFLFNLPGQIKQVGEGTDRKENDGK